MVAMDEIGESRALELVWGTTMGGWMASDLAAQRRVDYEKEQTQTQAALDLILCGGSGFGRGWLDTQIW